MQDTGAAGHTLCELSFPKAQVCPSVKRVWKPFLNPQHIISSSCDLFFHTGLHLSEISFAFFQMTFHWCATPLTCKPSPVSGMGADMVGRMSTNYSTRRSTGIKLTFFFILLYLTTFHHWVAKVLRSLFNAASVCICRISWVTFIFVQYRVTQQSECLWYATITWWYFMTLAVKLWAGQNGPSVVLTWTGPTSAFSMETSPEKSGSGWAALRFHWAEPFILKSSLSTSAVSDSPHFCLVPLKWASCCLIGYRALRWCDAMWQGKG